MHVDGCIYTIRLRCSVDYPGVAHVDCTATWGRRKLQSIQSVWYRVTCIEQLFTEIYFTHRYSFHINGLLSALTSLSFYPHK
jgi:hypothetical protein